MEKERRSLKILALYSIKGGVGKTAAAVNLSYLAASEGSRSLIWDLDPQGSSSYYFRIKPRIRVSGKSLIRGKSELACSIKGTDFDNLDLLPSDFSFRNLDLYLDQGKKPVKQLSKILQPLEKHYDYIFLDCPPNISLLSESVFGAADALISPIIPTTLSVRTLKQLKKYIESKNSPSTSLLAFFSMVDSRKKLHREIVENLHSDCQCLLETKVPYASDVERMGVLRAPVLKYSSKSRSSIAFRNLWAEINTRLYDRL